MATSGTYNFNQNKTQIITRALQLINVIDISSDPIPNEDYELASDVLNMMLGTWEIEGIHLWKRREATLFPALDQPSYQIGSVAGSDNCTDSYVSTTIDGSFAVGTSTFSVASTTGFAVSQNIGVEQSDGSRVWGTISSIDTNLSTITTTIVSTQTVVTSATVVAYTSKINRPLRILRASTYDLKANSEVTMASLSYDEYFNLPVKNNTGRPINWYYDRLINNSLPYTGTLYLYNQPQYVYQVVNFTYIDCIQEMLNQTDTPDLPQEWLYPISFCLGVELGYYYGKFVELEKLEPKAMMLKQALQDFDSDDASLKISFDSNYQPPTTI